MKLFAVATTTIMLATVAAAQVTNVNGRDLALRSSGVLAGNGWTLSSNGYVGTYVTLAQPGQVTITANAAGQQTPRMQLVIGDHKAGFDVAAGAASYATSVHLPAGTHFIRTEFNNDIPSADRRLTVNSLNVSGAAVSNFNTGANALAAADTYIANFRRGSANVALRGPGDIPLLPGTQVDVSMRRNAFNFGTAVAGFNGGTYLQNNPAPGSNAYNYQQALDANFNSIVPENAGKWGSNSSGNTPPAPGTAGNISYMNTMFNYAQQRDMRIRMHNLIWGSQQPNWVNNMLANTGSWTTLRNTYIPDRIRYYVGDANDGNPNDDPITRAVEIDVYNETWHTGAQNNTSFWRAYGAAGVAGIYNDVAAAAASVGSNATLFVNEYNVVQDGADPYANWYRNHVETLLNAGASIGGIGIQSYPNPTGIGGGNDQHDAARMFGVLQNLSVLDKALALTEFGAKSGTGEAVSAQILNEQLRLTYGTPDATGFMMWGFWQGDIFRGDAAFYTADWQPRMPLATWQALMQQWSTNLSAEVDADGDIAFTGYFGDYDIAGQDFAMELARDTNSYQVHLAVPPGWHFWNVANSGSFSSAGNWANGVPGGIGKAAHFGPSTAPRSVTLDSQVTLGQINFDSPAAYTISGATGAIVLEGPAGVSAIHATQGSHVINTQVWLNGDLRIDIADGARVRLAGNVMADERTITKLGGGVAEFRNVRADLLEIQSGVVRVIPDLVVPTTAGTSIVKTLSIAPAAAWDLTSNSAVIDYTGDSTLQDITALVAGGYNGGAWDGNGISSSAAAAASAAAVKTAIGVAEASDLFTSFPASFAGVAIDSTSVLLLYTVAGDANFDRAADIGDFAILAANFNQPGSWVDGDFDYTAQVDIGDFAILAAQFNRTLADAPRASVPEPACAAGIIALALVCRRSRRPGGRP